MYVLGIILILLGIILGLYGLSNFGTLSTPNLQGSFEQNTQLMNAGFKSNVFSMVTMFIGAVLIFAGGYIMYLASLRKIFSYVANETAPGLETITRAAAKGVRKGWTGGKR